MALGEPWRTSTRKCDCNIETFISAMGFLRNSQSTRTWLRHSKDPKTTRKKPSQNIDNTAFHVKGVALFGFLPTGVSKVIPRICNIQSLVLYYLGSLPRNPGGPRPGLVSQHRRSCSGFDHPCSGSITSDHLNLANPADGLHANLSPVTHTTLSSHYNFLTSCNIRHGPGFSWTRPGARHGQIGW